MKLTIELVPQTAWYANVRSNVTKAEWNIIRTKSYKAANYKCEICGGIGNKHPVECHEVWKYTKDKKQILTGFISLCPTCHKVKHIGLTQIRGEEEIAIAQLMKVNKLTRLKAINYINKAFVEWEQRSKFTWDLDISFIDKYIS